MCVLHFPTKPVLVIAEALCISIVVMGVLKVTLLINVTENAFYIIVSSLYIPAIFYENQQLCQGSLL